MSIQNYNANHKANQPTHIYYNMNILNNDSSFPAEPVKFQYKETRSNDFLRSPQDYYMSIVRFNLQSPTLPVFIPQINLNSVTNNGSIYPIRAMGSLSGTSFYAYLNDIYSVPVGAILLNTYSCATATISAQSPDTSNFQGHYSRVTATRPTGFNPTATGDTQVTTLLTLTNTNGNGGTPANYPSNTDIVGFTQTLQYARFSINQFAYNSSTNILTIDVTNPSTLASLTYVWFAGDTVYIQNSGAYNGEYIVASVSATQLTVKASNLIGVNIPSVNPVSSGETLSSVGDYINITPYTVTMTYTIVTLSATAFTYNVTIPIVYQPGDLTTVVPSWNPALPQALTVEALTSSYYYIFSYQRWINMVNTAMNSAFYILQGYMSNGAQLPPGTPYITGGLYLPTTAISTIVGNNPPTNALQINPPYMSWNLDTAKALITADNYGFNTVIRPYKASVIIQPILMYFNDPLATIADSFPYQFQNVVPASPLFAQVVFDFQSNASQYIVQSYSPIGNVIALATYLGVQITQDHQTASLLNPVQSIVFTSTLLPVAMEQVGTPLILNGASTNQTVLGSTANIFPIVTDFQVPFSAVNGYVPDITYQPSGEYRLVDLYGTSPCKQIDIQVFWKDAYGLLHPFYIGSGCQASLKLLFRSKAFNNQELS